MHANALPNPDFPEGKPGERSCGNKDPARPWLPGERRQAGKGMPESATAFTRTLPGKQAHSESNMTRLHGTAAPPHQVLDPRTLGRPVHLLQLFAAQLRDDLASLFRVRLNRRYRADFQVDGVDIDTTGQSARPGRWLSHAFAGGRIGCALDRSLVLSALAYRYGLHGSGQEAYTVSTEVPETATEERLTAMLSQQLAETLAARIAAAGHADDGEAPPPPASTQVGPTSPPRSACLITARVRESIHGITGNLHLAIDDAWLTQLLDQLSPAQRKRGKSSTYTPPLATCLHFKLEARLLQKELTLGELLDIRCGDVIPVSLRAADILVGDTRLFTATVAEHKGKLCLTTFEDAK